MIFGPKLVIGFIVWALEYKETNGHGRLIEPPSRASMWRYGFNTPPNYNDNELYCGGFTRQYQTNGGKCGICGDPWDAPQPRQNEAGGKYGQGVIVRRYKIGQPIIVRIELTANHRGYFEFRLCPNNAPKQVASQACLDKYVLRRIKAKDAVEAFHDTRFYPGTENKVYEMRYALPDGLTCSQCVLQWKYIAGNNWGECGNGTSAVGCGPQEEFRACADISVSDRDGTVDTSPYPTPVTVATTATSVTESVETNEIPDTTEPNHKPQSTGFSLAIFIVSIVLLSLGFILMVFMFVYWYFYHAGDTVKSWWRRMAESSYSCMRKSNINDEKKKSINEQPVPPPRVKKTTTIGFKGVPDNLV